MPHHKDPSTRIYDKNITSRTVNLKAFTFKKYADKSSVSIYYKTFLQKLKTLLY